MEPKVKFFRMNPYVSLPVKGSEHAVGFDIRSDLSALALKKYEKFSERKKKALPFDVFLKDFAFDMPPGKTQIIPSGLKVELPLDVEMAIKSRSGLLAKENLLAQGTIDPDYRGEIGIMIVNVGDKKVRIFHGERIAQAVFRKVYNHPDIFVEVNNESDLSCSDRGDNGFGSTGK